MSIFKGKKESSFLGVDIGSSGVKLVELGVEKGRAKLLTYSYSESLTAQSGISMIEHPERASKHLIKLIKDSGAKSTTVIASLPQHEVFSAVLSIPYSKDPKVMKASVEQLVKKLTPIPFGEMIIDSKVIDEHPKKAEFQPKEKKSKKEKKTAKKPSQQEPEQQHSHVRVLVTGASKSLAQRYIQLFKSAKLNLTYLETESLALIRSLVGKDRTVMMMIDIGSKRTNLTVVEKGVPFLTRSVNIGGDMITAHIAEKLGLDEKEADQIKRDLARGSIDETLPISQIFLKPILNEMQYMIGEFKRQEESEGQQIDKVILTGGSSFIPGIANEISNALSINTYIGDPWARVQIPQNLKPVLQEVGPHFSVAIGLAMRDIE